MSDRDKNRAIEREIRGGRGFSIAEAVGREGGGFISGGSPITPTEQVAHAAQQLLQRHLSDPQGTLQELLVRRIKNNTTLLDRHLDAPAAAITETVRPLLRSSYALEELVREVDSTWGREMDERPRFQRHGQPPHPDDVYTHAGVREALSALLAALEP